jgi:uncharacterized membrane protein YfcA
VIAGLLMATGGAVAGAFGSLLGLGGGVLIVPLLTLGFGLPLREAVGVSLVSVIVTSSAAAGVYLERHVANLRLGMTLELFTATGALVGGLVAFALPERVLAGLFALLLTYTAIVMLRRALPTRGRAADAVAAADAADVGDAADAARGPDPGPGPDGGSDPDPGTPVVPSGIVRARTVGATGGTGGPAATGGPGATSAPGFVGSLGGPGYGVHSFRFGIAGSLFAGVISALLGIGGGIVKVPLMNLAMGVPLRVATATSNLMIGITASASAIVYFLRDGIDPYVAAPTAIGVFIGASAGSRLAHRVDVRYLRALLIVILAYTAWQMATKALA